MCFAKMLLSLFGVTAPSRLCSFSVASAALLRTCAARSGEVDYCDCRHECHIDHVGGDHVHDDHDDHRNFHDDWS